LPFPKTQQIAVFAGKRHFLPLKKEKIFLHFVTKFNIRCSTFNIQHSNPLLGLSFTDKQKPAIAIFIITF